MPRVSVEVKRPPKSHPRDTDWLLVCHTGDCKWALELVGTKEFAESEAKFHRDAHREAK